MFSVWEDGWGPWRRDWGRFRWRAVLPQPPVFPGRRGAEREGEEREESPRVCVKATPTSQGGPKHAVRATKDIWAPANLTI